MCRGTNGTDHDHSLQREEEPSHHSNSARLDPLTINIS
jgi:hypothetical protein